MGQLVDLDDVIALLNEELDKKTSLALIPHELVHKQYAMLGVVDGIRGAIGKLENHFERERYGL